MAEKIRKAIEDYRFDGVDRPVTVSIGVSCYPSEGIEGLEDLVRRADEALYEAKRAGKNRVILWRMG